MRPLVGLNLQSQLLFFGRMKTMELSNWLRRAKRVLLIGGTFDPPHRAHLAQAQLAAKLIDADALLYIPAGMQPQKHNVQGQASPEDRLAMVKLMVQNCANAAVCPLEIQRQNDAAWAGKPNYTVDTISTLRDLAGSVDDEGPIFRLLIGSDQAANFHTWRDYQRLITLAEPVVMPRLPWTADTLIAHIEKTQSAKQATKWRHRLLDMPVMDASSTQIRQRIKDGLPVDQMVCPLVEQYIREHGLYLDV